MPDLEPTPVIDAAEPLPVYDDDIEIEPKPLQAPEPEPVPVPPELCDVCHTAEATTNKLYYYDIDCDCHDGNHIETVKHCDNCEPSAPINLTIKAAPSDAKLSAAIETIGQAIKSDPDGYGQELRRDISKSVTAAVETGLSGSSIGATRGAIRKVSDDAARRVLSRCFIFNNR